MTWNDEIVEQIDGHWIHQLRPRLTGMTTSEYLWEPVENCSNIRPASSSRSQTQVGVGEFRLDMVRPLPDPAPIPTIAWRMAHVTVSVIGTRLAGLFGRTPVEYSTWEFAGTADRALDQLDAVYADWIRCVRGLGDDGLLQPCGESEAAIGNSPDLPMVAIVVHISREIIHHGAEICLLRDLYAGRSV